MEQVDIMANRPKVKAAYRYEVVDTEKTPTIAGKRFHFIGVGGVGMSGLAKVMLKNKAIVTGSDQIRSSATDKLSELGADIKTGHCADNLHPQTEAVVISAAVTENNPELMLRKGKGLQGL